MTDRDNITLPREAVEKIHEAWSSEVYPPAASTEWYDIMDALRTALAAEQPKPEPVAYFDLQKQVFFWAKPTQIDVPMTVALEPLPLYTAPPVDEALRRENERLRGLLAEASKAVWMNYDGDLLDRIEAALKEVPR